MAKALVKQGRETTMVVDSQRWKCVEAVPAIAFSVEGTTAVRAKEPSARGWLTVAEGVVERLEEQRLELDGDVTLSFTLPARARLEPLVGSRVKLALREEPAGAGPRAQTLVVADERGRTRLVARYGSAGQTHTIGMTRVRTALSQRPHGPMAFGTDRLQYVVHVGQHVPMRYAADEFVVSFVARTAFDYVAYVVAERALWLSGRR
jgi:hypothetical protein